MTKYELGQIKKIVKEIDELTKQVKNAEYSIMPGTITDSVTGSSRSFPYAKHTIVIEGIDYSGYNKSVKRLKSKLQRRIEELQDKVDETYEYIESIEDSEIRMILTLRYINGVTWDQLEKDLFMNKRTAQIKFKKWWSESS